MAQRESALLTVTPRNLSGLAVIFLLLAVLFAALNGQKVKALRADAVTARAQVTAKVNAPTNDRAVKAETALAQAEKEKALLAEKLQDAQEHPGQVKDGPKTDTRKRRDTAMVQRQSSSSHRAGCTGPCLRTIRLIISWC